MYLSRCCLMHSLSLQLMSLRLMVASEITNFFRTPEATLPVVDVDFVLTVEVAEGGVFELTFLDFLDEFGVEAASLFLGASDVICFFVFLEGVDSDFVPAAIIVNRVSERWYENQTFQNSYVICYLSIGDISAQRI